MSLPQVPDRRAAFLSGTAYADWLRIPLPGDASSRGYERLTGPDGQSVILMDSDESTLAPFIAMADHLRAHGLAAPAILTRDGGLAVIEDLGPLHFGAWLGRAPQDATLLYAAAVDVLVRLQDVPPLPGLTALGPLRAAAMIDPLFDWHLPGSDQRWRAHVTGLLQGALAAHCRVADRLSLRDFHAENLIWRPDRQGNARVGLLDFQDAVAAPRDYDLASLLRDARRDVPGTLRVAMIDRFARATARSYEETAAATAVLAVQRNLRIMGIFARLARRDGKTRYLAFMPRLHAMIVEDLSHPALADLARVLLPGLPAPRGLAP